MKKHLRYLRYVLIHKFWCLVYCWEMGLYWRGVTHDLSKFRPSEWFPYVNSFYGPWTYEGRPWIVVFRFDVAWLEHQHRNDHHWQHWILREDDGDTKPLLVPGCVLLEMLCDWRAAGKAITGDGSWKRVRAWWDKQDQILPTATRKAIEDRLAYQIEREEKSARKGPHRV